MKTLLAFLSLFLVVAGLRAANPSGSGTNGFLPLWNSARNLTNSGIIQIGIGAYSVGGDGTETDLVNRDTGRAVGLGRSSVTNYANLSDVTGVGYQALKQANASFLVGVGDDALGKNTGGTRNCALGSQALFNNTNGNDNSGFGYQVASTLITGKQNSAFGSRALLSARGNNNSSLGYRSGQTLVTGNDNVTVGYQADLSGIPANSNVVIGASALCNDQSVVIGSGSTVGDASAFLTVIGNDITIGQFTNAAALGWKATAFAHNMVRLGNDITTTTVTSGNVTATNGFSQRAGSGASNAWSSGLMFFSQGNFTNLNAASTLSNLANVSIPAHTLTNSGDRIFAEWEGVMPAAAANTNEFTIVYGSQTILDTGLQIASNTTFYGWVKIARTGNTSQHAFGHFEWGPNGGVPFAFTNVNVEIAQTNGISTTLAMQNGARRVGAVTNNSFRVNFEPATR